MGLFSSKKSATSPPAVTPTWTFGERPSWMVDGIQASLFYGPETLDVVGESFRQEELWSLAGALAGVKRGGEVRAEVVALLVAEAGNPYDSNAVAVWIAGLQVGYISRESAPEIRRALLRLQVEKGGPIGVQGHIVGGGPGRENLGVFLDFDPADFGMAWIGTHASDHVRTGLSQAAGQTRTQHHRWDIVWDGGESPRHIADLRALLDTDSDPVFRHFVFAAVEDAFYRGREIGPEYLEQYDMTCEAHFSELPSTRAALKATLGVIPVVDTFRQAAIRWQKAHDFERSLTWATRGLDFYGDEPERAEEIVDLQKRAARCRNRMEPQPARNVSHARTASVAATEWEALTCQTCGKTFERARTRGRKPLECPDCRGGGKSTEAAQASLGPGPLTFQTPSAIGGDEALTPIAAPAPGPSMAYLPAAGWYSDPERAELWRYWDGRQWTANTAPK